MKKISLLVFLGTILGMTVVFAYSGSYTKMDIETVIEQGRDDQHIVIEGKFVEHLYGDNYVFKDMNGKTMTVEVDDDCIAQVKLNQAVRAYGEIDIDHGKIEVEFDRIETI